MNRRTRKIQARYQVSGLVGQHQTKVSPTLELAGKCGASRRFWKTGFSPGQPVHIETRNREIIIRPAHE